VYPNHSPCTQFTAPHHKRCPKFLLFQMHTADSFRDGEHTTLERPGTKFMYADMQIHQQYFINIYGGLRQVIKKVILFWINGQINNKRLKYINTNDIQKCGILCWITLRRWRFSFITLYFLIISWNSNISVFLVFIIYRDRKSISLYS
jgi:hypothetical protein